MLTMNQLKYFVTTVQLGSINKAAKVLYISQPALTKQIIKLEEQINCKLMERTYRGIELTEAGRYLYNQATMILDKLKETENHLHSFQHKKTVRIGALPSIANYFLPDFLQNKKLSFIPKVLVQDLTQMLANSVEEGKIDMAIVQDFDETLSLNVFHLFTERYVLALPKNHRLSNLEPIHFHDFISYPIYMWHDPSDLRQSLRILCNYYKKEAVFIDVPWNESLLAHILQKKGITFIPEIVSKHLKTDELEIKSIKPSSFGRKIQVIYKKEKKDIVSKIFTEPNIFDTMSVQSYFPF
ncbi:LysR family transcriptional regulator [Shimazuella alba]|uniref:LysR family transcriptional regulator n=1 Tax=Shimazuella alba TaxID=2690964 RepID=A0A6I4VVU4_9BACL|nr:LysR family transcriptional regulator [Shimazuella alba]MXQ52644.1 LysR family transcriptional regulator [Shimazuella alba]